MKAVFYTTKGPVRPHNEDGLYINGSIYSSMAEPGELELNLPYGLFAVVDGMGGMGGGEMAASIILNTLDLFRDTGPPACELLERGLIRIQKELHAKASSFPFMGAALAGLWLNPDQNLAFNCGDCRVYSVHSGKLEKLTHDHSIVQELFDNGAISEEEMRFHPNKNILTSALSANDADPNIYCQKFIAHKGDRFLICSDGLWESLSNPQLHEILEKSVSQAALTFAQHIWELRASDNVSFILIELD